MFLNFNPVLTFVVKPFLLSRNKIPCAVLFFLFSVFFFLFNRWKEELVDHSERNNLCKERCKSIICEWQCLCAVACTGQPTGGGRIPFSADLLHSEEGTWPLLAGWSCLPFYPTLQTRVMHLSILLSSVLQADNERQESYRKRLTRMEREHLERPGVDRNVSGCNNHLGFTDFT